MRYGNKLSWVGVSMLALVITGCTLPEFDSRTLYEQLGGKPGIDRLVERFIREIAADPEISHHFRGTDVHRFRDMLAEQVCAISDGPCVYTGGSMLEVHRNLQITQRDFNALVEDLIRAMDSLQLPTPTQNRLLAKLAPMRSDIVDSDEHRSL